MRGTPTSLKDFSPGLNLAEDPVSLPWGTASAMANVESNGKSGLHRREAMSQVRTTAAAPYTTAGHLWVAGTQVFYRDSAGIPNVYAGSGTTLGTLTLGNYEGAITQGPLSGGQGPYYMVTTSGTPKYWDGAAASFASWTASAGSIPQASSMVYAGGRMIAAAPSSVSQRVSASAPGDPRDWSTATGHGWFVDFDDDSSAIIGLARCGPYVIVVKTDRIHLIYDLDTGANRVLCRSLVHGSSSVIFGGAKVVSDTDYAYWLAYDGVYRTNGSSVERISTALGTALFNNVALGGVFSKDRLAITPGWLAYINENDAAMYVLDLYAGSWWRHTFTGVAGAHIVGLPDTTPQFLIQRSGVLAQDSWAPGRQRTTPTATTDGTTSPATFTCSWQGGLSDFGRPSVFKRVRSLTTVGSVAAGALSVGIGKEGAAASMRSTGLPSTAYSTVTLPTWGVARLWQLQLSDTTTSRWSLEELEIDWQARKG